ncbi:MAG: DUF4296 domain-containing protein [Lentimicrobium sp.]|nr:DUF4296 domain-containing protein [Lentimicrobium sp.]
MRSGKGYISILLVSLIIGLTGCINDQKEFASGQKQIPREQMIRLMADMELTEAALKAKQVKLSRDSIKKIAAQSYDSLYSFYGVTPEQFKENLRYYQIDLEDFQAMSDSVIITLTRHKDSVSNLKKTPADTTIIKSKSKIKIK